MELLEKQPTDLNTDKPPKMTHLVDWGKGFPYALCGYVCEEIIERNLPKTKKVDCVVCEELWELGR